MALNKEIKEYLDSLSDDELMFELWLRFGTTILKWEECSKEEYEKHYGKVEDHSWNSVVKFLTSDTAYKVEPIYNTPYTGILFHLEEHEPIGYKYYKQIGEERILMLGSDMFEYCKNRECTKDMFQ